VGYTGELAALTAAALWAFTSVIWSRVGSEITPLALNVYKACIATLFLSVTLIVTHPIFPTLSPLVWGLLALSGVLGIALGDTLYLFCLNALGPRRALLLDALSPCFAAILALMFLKEQLTFTQWLGVGLTVAGVVWVLSERTPEDGPQYALELRGVVYGILTALITAGGGVMSRAAFLQTSIDPLWSAWIRLVAALLFLLPWWWRDRASLQDVLQPRLGGIVVGTAFLGTYLGIWLQQTAFKYTASGIGQALSATSPLFILPLDIFRGKPVTLRDFLGVSVALAGIGLLFLRF
jgi:drug/metabolite transporter (DMT)-like permease